MRLVRPGSATAMARLVAEARGMEPTYPERGATLGGELPPGYHHTCSGAVLGRGLDAFAGASEGLRTWRAHRLRGVRVFPATPALHVGTTVVVTLGTRFGAVAAPCRIIAVVDEPRRFGFAYGTLPSHPECGEESFVVTVSEDGTVRFDIRAFSRPGEPLARIAGPIGRLAQATATRRYLAALRRFVDDSDQM